MAWRSDILLKLSFGFVPAILKPYFDLRVKILQLAIKQYINMYFYVK